MASKADYLKKYLSGPDADDGKKKKKKKKPSSSHPSQFAIVDDDADDWKRTAPTDDAAAALAARKRLFGLGDEELAAVASADALNALDTREDMPLVVGDEAAEREARERAKWNRSNWETTEADNSGDASPRRARHDSPSPTRAGAADTSPPRRKRHDSPDNSPPRRSAEDLSPPRARRRHDSPDKSPPRKRGREDDNAGDLSPPRARRRHDSPEASPPRRPAGGKGDLSPPRRGRSDNDQSPPRRRADDLSPPRRRAEASEDLSPPRKGGDLSPPRRRPLMSSGHTAGLHTAAEIMEQNVAKRQREVEAFRAADPTALGRGAETVYRDKSGKRIDVKFERLRKREEEAKKQEELERQMEWGKGIAQKKAREERLGDIAHEVNKPFARYRDDEDLEAMLREREREGDPMAAMFRKKKAANAPQRPVYRGPPPQPNRFGLAPGYRWDGVDRSNGFEKRFYERQAGKTATADEAYKWSVEDM